MNLITIDPDKCKHDDLCVQVCPINILRSEKGQTPTEDAELAKKCIRCGHCVAICPTGALSNSLMPVEEFQVAENRPGAEQVEALLLGRRSIRGFRKSPVQREQLEQLLEVVRRAPTASNTQNVAWNIIQAPQLLEQIREKTLDWLCSDPTRTYHREAAKQGRDPILRGGTVLAVAHCPKDYYWTEIDSAIAITYMELYASSMRLGACWGGLVTKAAHDIPEIAHILGVPEGRRLGGALMLGLPRHKHRLVPPRNPVQVTWL